MIEPGFVRLSITMPCGCQGSFDIPKSDLLPALLDESSMIANQIVQFGKHAAHMFNDLLVLTHEGDRNANRN